MWTLSCCWDTQPPVLHVKLKDEGVFFLLAPKYWGLRLVLFGFQDEYAKQFQFYKHAMQHCSNYGLTYSIEHLIFPESCLKRKSSIIFASVLISHLLGQLLNYIQRNMKMCGGKLSDTFNQAVWARASFFFFFFYNLFSQLALLMMCVKRNQTSVPLHPQVMDLKWILWSRVIDGEEFADSMRDH